VSALNGIPKTLDDINQFRPHAGRPRQVQPGQLIHESVFENIKSGNIPKALLYDSLDWNAIEEFDDKKLVERDLFSNASALMDKLKKKNEDLEVDASTLLTLLASGEWMLIGISIRNSN
jgi:hypothetical protein